MQDKKVTTLREREEERARKAEAERIAALCADWTWQLTNAGWTEVKVEARPVFVAASGTDPHGVNRAAVDVNGQAAIDHLLTLGVPGRMVKPQPQEKSEPTPVRETVREVIVEVPVEDPAMREKLDMTTAALTATKNQLADLQAKIDASRTPEPPAPTTPDAEAEEPPPELAVLIEADETLADARGRLAEEYQQLRSMYVGHMDMTETQHERWRRLGSRMARAWLRVVD